MLHIQNGDTITNSMLSAEVSILWSMIAMLPGRQVPKCGRFGEPKEIMDRKREGKEEKTKEKKIERKKERKVGRKQKEERIGPF